MATFRSGHQASFDLSSLLNQLQNAKQLAQQADGAVSHIGAGGAGLQNLVTMFGQLETEITGMRASVDGVKAAMGDDFAKKFATQLDAEMGKVGTTIGKTADVIRSLSNFKIGDFSSAEAATTELKRLMAMAKEVSMELGSDFKIDMQLFDKADIATQFSMLLNAVKPMINNFNLAIGQVDFSQLALNIQSGTKKAAQELAEQREVLKKEIEKTKREMASASNMAEPSKIKSDKTYTDKSEVKELLNNARAKGNALFEYDMTAENTSPEFLKAAAEYSEASQAFIGAMNNAKGEAAAWLKSQQSEIAEIIELYDSFRAGGEDGELAGVFGERGTVMQELTNMYGQQVNELGAIEERQKALLKNEGIAVEKTEEEINVLKKKEAEYKRILEAMIKYNNLLKLANSKEGKASNGAANDLLTAAKAELDSAIAESNALLSTSGNKTAIKQVAANPRVQPETFSRTLLKFSGESSLFTPEQVAQLFGDAVNGVQEVIEAAKSEVHAAAEKAASDKAAEEERKKNEKAERAEAIKTAAAERAAAAAEEKAKSDATAAAASGEVAEATQRSAEEELAFQNKLSEMRRNAALANDELNSLRANASAAKEKSEKLAYMLGNASNISEVRAQVTRQTAGQNLPPRALETIVRQEAKRQYESAGTAYMQLPKDADEITRAKSLVGLDKAYNTLIESGFNQEALAKAKALMPNPDVIDQAYATLRKYAEEQAEVAKSAADEVAAKRQSVELMKQMVEFSEQENRIVEESEVAELSKSKKKKRKSTKKTAATSTEDEGEEEGTSETPQTGRGRGGSGGASTAAVNKLTEAINVLIGKIDGMKTSSSEEPQTAPTSQPAATEVAQAQEIKVDTTTIETKLGDVVGKLDALSGKLDTISTKMNNPNEGSDYSQLVTELSGVIDKIAPMIREAITEALAPSDMPGEEFEAALKQLNTAIEVQQQYANLYDTEIDNATTQMNSAQRRLLNYQETGSADKALVAQLRGAIEQCSNKIDAATKNKEAANAEYDRLQQEKAALLSKGTTSSQEVKINTTTIEAKLGEITGKLDVISTKIGEPDNGTDYSALSTEIAGTIEKIVPAIQEAIREVLSVESPSKLDASKGLSLTEWTIHQQQRRYTDNFNEVAALQETRSAAVQKLDELNGYGATDEATTQAITRLQETIAQCDERIAMCQEWMAEIQASLPKYEATRDKYQAQVDQPSESALVQVLSKLEVIASRLDAITTQNAQPQNDESLKSQSLVQELSSSITNQITQLGTTLSEAVTQLGTAINESNNVEQSNITGQQAETATSPEVNNGNDNPAGASYAELLTAIESIGTTIQELCTQLANHPMEDQTDDSSGEPIIEKMGALATTLDGLKEQVSQIYSAIVNENATDDTNTTAAALEPVITKIADLCSNIPTQISEALKTLKIEMPTEAASQEPPKAVLDAAELEGVFSKGPWALESTLSTTIADHLKAIAEAINALQQKIGTGNVGNAEASKAVSNTEAQQSSSPSSSSGSGGRAKDEVPPLAQISRIKSLYMKLVGEEEALKTKYGEISDELAQTDSYKTWESEVHRIDGAREEIDKIGKAADWEIEMLLQDLEEVNDIRNTFVAEADAHLAVYQNQIENNKAVSSAKSIIGNNDYFQNGLSQSTKDSQEYQNYLDKLSKFTPEVRRQMSLINTLTDEEQANIRQLVLELQEATDGVKAYEAEIKRADKELTSEARRKIKQDYKKQQDAAMEARPQAIENKAAVNSAKSIIGRDRAFSDQLHDKTKDAQVYRDYQDALSKFTPEIRKQMLLVNELTEEEQANIRELVAELQNATAEVKKYEAEVKQVEREEARKDKKKPKPTVSEEERAYQREKGRLRAKMETEGKTPEEIAEAERKAQQDRRARARQNARRAKQTAALNSATAVYNNSGFDPDATKGIRQRIAALGVETTTIIHQTEVYAKYNAAISEIYTIKQKLNAIDKDKWEQQDVDALNKATETAKRYETELNTILTQQEHFKRSGLAGGNGVISTTDAAGFMDKNLVERQAMAEQAAYKLMQERGVKSAYLTKGAAQTNEDPAKFSAQMADAKGNVYRLEMEYDKLNGQIRTYISNTNMAVPATGKLHSLFGKLGAKLKQYSMYFGASTIVFRLISAVRNGITAIKDLDKAMVELKKVTDETEGTYKRFLDTAAETSARIGTTVTDLVNSTADFARLGYSMQEAAKLAEVAGIYMNVADGLDSIDTASEDIISTMKAFGIEASNAMEIVDKFNETGNNFAISSAGVGEAMKRSAAALSAAGNDINETIGLITAANTVVQDPDVVGTALKTLAMRLRGTKTEMEEAGLETDGMADSISQLRDKLMALSHQKVDILADNNTYKSTTEIIREMAGAWDEMTDMEQAAATELMGGKRQGNILASMIENWDVAEDAIKGAIDAEGSAVAENEKYLDSIEGKTQQFNNAVQVMWNNLINSEVIKFFVDLGTVLVKVIDAIGLAGIAAGVFFGIMKKDAIAMVTLSFEWLVQQIFFMVGAFATAAEAGTGLIGVLKGIGAAFTASPFVGIAAALALIGGAVAIIDAVTTSFGEAKEQFQQTKQEASDAKTELSQYQDELKSIGDRIDELNDKDSLSLTEQSELDRLKAEKIELEEKVRLQEKYVELKNKEAVKDANETISKDERLNHTNTAASAAGASDGSVDYALDQLNAAKQNLDEAQAEFDAAVESGDQKSVDKAQENLTKWQSIYDDQAAKAMEATDKLQADYAGIDYQTGPDLDEEQRIFNESLLQIQEYIDRRNILLADGDQEAYDTAVQSATATRFTKMADDEENAINQMVEQGASVEEVIKALESDDELSNWMESIGVSAEDVAHSLFILKDAAEETGDAVDYMSDVTSNINTIDSLADSYNTLQAAVDEFNTNGALSAETLNGLINNNLLQYLTITENGIAMNASALVDQADAAKYAALQSISLAMAQDMDAIASGNLDQASAFAQQAVTNMGDAATVAAQKAQNATVGIDALATSMYNAYQAAQGKASTKQIKTQLSAVYDAYQGIFNAVRNTSFQSSVKSKASGGGSGSGSSASKELIDWIEHYYEPIERAIDEANARLENKLASPDAINMKNTILDQIIDLYGQKTDKIEDTLSAYEQRAAYLFSKFSKDIQDKIKNGSLNIDEISDKDLKTNIDNYFKYIEAASKAKIEIEKLKKEIADAAKQKLDNVSTAYENEISLSEKFADALQGEIDLLETRGEKVGVEYYKSLIENSEERISLLRSERNEMQAVLDEAVRSGQVAVGSEQWYDMVSAILDVDASIQDSTKDIEDFKKSIRDIRAESFDQLLEKFERLNEQLEFLFDRLTDDDGAFDENGWTDKGIAALGMLAEQMELARSNANECAHALEQLERDYKSGVYSEQDYAERKEELLSKQRDEINKYESAKDAIVDLNKARIEAIKDGINKEIDAYKKLVDKKKELLNAEKELYNYQKDIQAKQKNIALLKKQIAALSGSTSAEDIAERIRKEAELAEAKQELDDTTYEHSIDVTNDALDKEVDAREKQLEQLSKEYDKWLDDRERVISESLDTVKQNTEKVLQQISDLSVQYGLEIAPEIIAPWKEGENAVDAFKDAFAGEGMRNATSAFEEELSKIKDQWEANAKAAEDSAKRQIAAIQQQVTETVKAYKQVETAANSASKAAASTSNVWTSSSSGGGDGGYIGSTGGGTQQTQEKKWHGKEAGRATKDVLWDKYYGTLTMGGVVYYKFNNGTKEKPDYIYFIADQLEKVSKNGKVYYKSHKGQMKYKWDYYAKGTKSVNKDKNAIIDELGEELVLHAGENGRLQYLSKGTGVIPADMTENLMKLAELDPRDILARNKPTANLSPIVSSVFDVDLNIAEVVHVDHVDNDTLPDLTKAVKDQLDKYMKQANQSLKRYTR